jgi:predicted dienelactone hydrolase
LFGLLAVLVAGLGAGIYVAAQASAGQSRHASASAAPGKTPTPRATPSPSSPPHPSGSLSDYDVSERWFTFTEHAGAALGDRVLQVTIRYPDVGQAQHSGAPGTSDFPLIVFAPGYRQCTASYNILLREWASAGYVIAAVNFPRTNCHVVSPDEADLVNQPADLAFVIQQLDQMSSQPSGALYGLINPTRVAVAGHSDGGDTVAAMAGMSCCRYPQLRAAVVLAGAEWPTFAGHWFSAPTAPMLIVQGTADAWNPPATSLQLYQADTSGPRYYLQLPGANHFTPYEGNSAPEPIVVQVTIDFLDHYLAGDTGTLSAMSQAGRVSGVSELVSGGQLP